MSNNIEKTYNESTTYQGPQSWSELKQSGSQHYKTGGVEPIDLYRAGGMFRDFALCSIIKYAFRNRNPEEPISAKDMTKIIDYAQKLMATRLEE
jgi:hypothetical protein